MDRPFAWIGIVLLALWLVLIVDKTVPYDLASHGLRPRTLAGLPGIITMPFLHGGFRHLLGNSVSLGILLALLSGSQKHARPLALVTAISGSCLLWVAGRDANHLGASAWIFGLVGLMIGLGYFDRRVVPVLVAVAVGILFG
ncbi:MAG: rhomboid family intramembrane serine protease, partial [Planctomycetota bacterium]